MGLAENEFVRAHGLGNDYLVFDGARLGFGLKAEAVRRICHRHYGVGSDGILLLVPPDRADFGLRILNPDGSEAEKSGNGLRIFAHFLFSHGYTPRETFTVDTPGGMVECRLRVEGGRVRAVTVGMGRASFRSDQIPMTGPAREVVGETLEAAGRRLSVTALSIGNPHCVIVGEAWTRDDLFSLGPAIETHPAFPRRTNVQLATVEGRDRVRMLVWERGAGHTLASGSSACAAAAACRRLGLVGPGVRVVMEGGELEVEVGPDWSLRQTGPVEEVCRGVLSPGFVAGLGADQA